MEFLFGIFELRSAQAAVDYVLAEARDPFRAPKIRDPAAGPDDMVFLHATEDELRDAKGAYIILVRGLWEDGYVIVRTRTWYTGEDNGERAPKNVDRSFRETAPREHNTGECAVSTLKM